MERSTCKLIVFLCLACCGCQSGPKLSGLMPAFRKPDQVNPQQEPEMKVTATKPPAETPAQPAEKSEEPKPPAQKPAETNPQAVAGVQHDPETLKLIEEELKYAETPEEREQILTTWKQFDPQFIRELVRMRRMVRQHMQPGGPPSASVTQVGHTQPASPQTEPEVKDPSPEVAPNPATIHTGLGPSPWGNDPSGTGSRVPLTQSQSSPLSQSGQPIQAAPHQQFPMQQVPNQQFPASPIPAQNFPAIQAHQTDPGQLQSGQWDDQFPPVFENMQNPGLQLPGTVPSNPSPSLNSPTPAPNTFPLQQPIPSQNGFPPTQGPLTSINQESLPQQMPVGFPGQMPEQGLTNQAAPLMQGSTTPNPVSNPAQGVIQARWKEDLQKMIALAEVEVNNLPLGATPQEQQRYVEEQVHLRLLYLLAGQPERTIQPIPGLEPAQQEFWQQVFWGMSNYFDEENIPQQADRMSQTVSQFRNAIQHLQSIARLELRNVNFCHQITSFGNYEKFPADEFSRGQPVLVYAEVANFTSRPSADGTHYETSLKSTIEIYQAGQFGGLVERVDFPAKRDLSHNHRQDYFHSYEFEIPKQIGLGPHVLKLTLEDQLGKKIATYTLNFTVK